MGEAADFPNAQDEVAGTTSPVHDATHVFFDELTGYTSWLPDVTCNDSIMLARSTPAPVVTSFPPIACRVEATTSGLAFAAP
jgi:hypothetical protein